MLFLNRSMFEREQLTRCGQRLLVGLSGIIALVALASVLPPLFMPMIALRILATEAGPWLLIASGIVVVLALIPSTHRRLRLVSAILAGGAGIILIFPLCSLPRAITNTDLEFDRAFGPTWRGPGSKEDSRAMRPMPFSARDALFGIPAAAVPETTLSIPTSGDDAQPAIRYGDQTAVLRPVIVVIHGGGWHGGSIDEGAGCHRYLAAHGYLVYSIGYRLAPTTQFPGQLEDVRAALAWITAQAAASGGDPSRIVVMGRSAGAQLAMVLAYAWQEPSIRAVVSWYGSTDLAIGYRDPPHPDPLDVRTLISDYLGGTPDQLPERYAQASPISYATRPLPPTLLIAGGNDHGVRMIFQEQMRNRLITTGTTVALVTLPWAEHAFDRVPQGPGAQVTLYYLERFLSWATRL